MHSLSNWQSVHFIFIESEFDETVREPNLCVKKNVK